MKQIVAYTTCFCLLLVALATPGLAQEEEKNESDNTGTNPINFTYDARFYTETSWLTADDASLITNTFELRMPLGRTMSNLTNQKLGIFNDLGSRHAFRFKYRYKSLNVVDPGGSPVNVSGTGDMDLRYLYIPHVTNKFGIATGLEVFLPTATNDALGDGKVILRPQVFAGFFGLFGKTSIFAPGLLYLIDVAGDDDRASVNQWQMDIYFVWILAQQKHWLIINPQPVVDVANDKEFMIVDVEFGFMIPQLAGASTWIRPGAGVGSDRPFDLTFEFGFKWIWR
jgi:hypothetical protein